MSSDDAKTSVMSRDQAVRLRDWRTTVSTKVFSRLERSRPEGTPALVTVWAPRRSDIGKHHVLSARATRIGRAPDNDIVLAGAGVSRLHARIERRNRQYFLVDLGSTNGTFLNDEAHAVTARRLRNGDELRIGDTVFQCVGAPDRDDPYPITSFNAALVPRAGRALECADPTQVLSHLWQNPAPDRSLLCGLPGATYACAVLSSSGEILAARGHRLHAFDPRNGEIRRTFDDIALCNAETAYEAATASSDGLHVAEINGEGTLTLWSLRDERTLARSSQDFHVLDPWWRRESSCAAISPGGDQLVWYCDMNYAPDCLRVWSHGSESCVENTGTVTAVALLPDGARVVSAGSDAGIRIWSIAEQKLLRALAGHAAKVNSLCVLPDGARIVSGSDDGTIRVWSVEEGCSLVTLWNDVAVTCVVPTADGQHLVSGDACGFLRVWSLGKGRAVQRIDTHSGAIARILLPDAEHAVTSDVTGTTRIWALNRFAAAGEQPSTIPVRIRARTMLVTSDRSAIVLASEEGRFGVWSARTGDLLRIQNTDGRCLGSAIAADGSVAVTIAGSHAGAAPRVRAWSLQSGGLVRSLECEDLVACAVSPEGTSVVLVGEELRVWSLASGEIRCLDWARPAGSLDFTAITPDGKHLVALSSGHDQSVCTIVSLETGHTLRAIHMTGAKVRCARLSADGLRLFVATESKRPSLPGKDPWGKSRIYIVCLRTGELVETLEVSATTELAVTPEGTRIVCAGPDRALTVWDVATGAIAGRFCHDTAFAKVAAIDEQTFAAADDWGKLHVLELEQRGQPASVRAGSRL